MSSTVSIQTAVGSLDLHAVAVASGYLGAALGVGMVVPQILRTLADRTRPGVSALGWSLMALSCLTWLLYGIRAGEIPQIPGNVLMVSGAAAIVLTVPSDVRVAARAVLFTLPALALVALATVLPPEAIGFLAFGIGMLSALPQTARSLWRAERGESAVSVAAWVLRAVSQACWLFYALVLHDVTVTVSAGVLLTSAILVATAELRARRATGAPATPATLIGTAATGVEADGARAPIVLGAREPC